MEIVDSWKSPQYDIPKSLAKLFPSVLQIGLSEWNVKGSKESRARSGSAVVV